MKATAARIVLAWDRLLGFNQVKVAAGQTAVQPAKAMVGEKTSRTPGLNRRQDALGMKIGAKVGAKEV